MKWPWSRKSNGPLEQTPDPEKKHVLEEVKELERKLSLLDQFREVEQIMRERK